MEFGSSSEPPKKPDGSSCPKKTRVKRFGKLYKGARQRKGNWVAEIRIPKTNKRIWLGTFDTSDAAARAYDFASYHIYGPNGPCNFPKDRSPQGVSQLIASETATSILQMIARHSSVGADKVYGAKSPSKQLTNCPSIDEQVVNDRLDRGELAAIKDIPGPVVPSKASDVDFTSNAFEVEPYFPTFTPEEEPLPQESFSFDEAFIKESNDWILDFMAEPPPKND